MAPPDFWGGDFFNLFLKKLLYIYKYIVANFIGGYVPIQFFTPFSILEGSGARTIGVGRVWLGTVCRQVGPADSAVCAEL